MLLPFVQNSFSGRFLVMLSHTLMKGEASLQGTLAPLDPLSCPILGLAFWSNVGTFNSWTCHVHGRFVFRTSLGTSILLGSTLLYEVHNKLDFRYGWPTLNELLPFFKILFPDFSWQCSHITEWKLVGSFHMNSYRSSATFVMIDLLFHELLPFVQNSFFGFVLDMFSHI